MSISQREDYRGRFGDKRLDKRASQLSAMLYFGRTSSIHEASYGEAEQKAAYRFLNNEKVEEHQLIEGLKGRSSYLCAGREVLVIQDTTEVNLENHRNRLKQGTGIGLTGNNNDIGFCTWEHGVGRIHGNDAGVFRHTIVAPAEDKQDK